MTILFDHKMAIFYYSATYKSIGALFGGVQPERLNRTISAVLRYSPYVEYMIVVQ